MNFLHTVWPTPFQIKPKSIGSLVVQLVIFLIICAIAGVFVHWLSNLWLIGWIFRIIGGLVDIYCTVGIVLSFLVFFGLLQ